MERRLAVRQNNRQQLSKRSPLIPAITQCRASRKEQQSPAAPIHKLLQKFLLRGRKPGSIHRPQNDRLILEQILSFRWKAVLQLMPVARPLAIDLVLRRPQHRHNFNRLVVFHRASQELELPTRLAFHIKDAWLRRSYIKHPRHFIVRSVLLTRHRRHFDLHILRARRTGVEQHLLSLLPALCLVYEILSGQHLAALLHRDFAVLTRIPTLPERHHRRQPRIFERPRRDHRIADLHIFVELLTPNANRVNRNLVPLDFLDRLESDTARVLRAIAQQHHRPNRQILRLTDNLRQRRAQLGRRLVGL